jgi:hypothetical protein
MRKDVDMWGREVSLLTDFCYKSVLYIEMISGIK